MPKSGVGGKRRRHGHPKAGRAVAAESTAPGGDDPALDIRQHLARELHDKVSQTLSAMLIDLDRFKSDQTGRASVLRQVDLLQEWTRDALANVRGVVYDLRGEPAGDDFPSLLRTRLLDPYASRTGIDVRMVVADDWPAKLPPGIAVDLYMIVQEALQNAHRHGGAKFVQVNLGPSAVGGLMSITVSDDGRGFPTVGELRPGQGIIGMRERAALLGGELETQHNPAGGSAIRIVIPLTVEPPSAAN